MNEMLAPYKMKEMFLYLEIQILNSYGKNIIFLNFQGIDQIDSVNELMYKCLFFACSDKTRKSCRCVIRYVNCYKILCKVNGMELC